MARFGRREFAATTMGFLGTGCGMPHEREAAARTQSEPKTLQPEATMPEHEVPAFTPIDLDGALVSRRRLDPDTDLGFPDARRAFEALAQVDLDAIVYRSGGIEVDAFVASPKGGGRHPTVLFARGGGARSLIRAPMLGKYVATVAARGFTVVASQLRTPPQGHDEFGGAELADLLNLLPVLDELPEANRGEVGVLGWSRGAMTVYLALAHAPTAFRAGIACAGAADQFGELRRRPEMESVFEEQIPNYDRDRDRALARRSPALWAERLPTTAPILLMHGTADWRVSPNESLKMAGRFQELQIPYRLMMFEGADHGIREHKDEVTSAIAAWFSRYLPTGAPLPDMTPHGR